MAATPDGKGYWLVAADGGIFTFGDAQFYGSAGAANLPDAVVGMVASPDGGGYLLATENGVVLPFGDAQAFGGLSLEPDGDADLGHHREQPGDRVLAARPAGLAVQLRDRHGRTEFPGSATIAAAAASQIEPDPDTPGRLLQPVRPVRGVVRAVRHLGLGAGRRAHPALRLHG